MSQEKLLSIKKADFGYASGIRFHPVIHDVSFELGAGDFVVLEGPNGCGKSTILRALLSMDAQFRGDIDLKTAMSDIGYIPQETRLDLSAPVTASDVIRSAFPFGRPSKGRVQAALKRVGLEHVCEDKFGALSGGQRRRVLLARALAYEAKLIILDEPTANIDIASEKALEALLTELVESEAKAVLATTHAAHWAMGARRIQLRKGLHCG